MARMKSKTLYRLGISPPSASAQSMEVHTNHTKQIRWSRFATIERIHWELSFVPADRGRVFFPLIFVCFVGTSSEPLRILPP